jgi:hypothetical protein
MLIADADVHHTLWLRELPQRAAALSALAVSAPPGPQRSCVRRVRLLGSLVDQTDQPDGSTSWLLDDTTGLCLCELPPPVAAAAVLQNVRLGTVVEVLGAVRIDSQSLAVSIVCVSARAQHDPL